MAVRVAGNERAVSYSESPEIVPAKIQNGIQAAHNDKRRIQGTWESIRKNCQANAGNTSRNQGAQLRGAHSTLVQSAVPAHDEKRGCTWIEGGEEMNELLPDQIETCKREIAYAADYAGLKWSRDDLVSVHEPDLGEIIFLRRFNPYDAIDDAGNTVTKWHDTMWFERVIGQPVLDVQRDGEKFTYTYHPGSLICVAPWLIRIIKKDGTIEGGKDLM